MILCTIHLNIIGYKDMSIKNIKKRSFVWVILCICFLAITIILVWVYMYKSESFDEVAIFEEKAKILEKTEQGTYIVEGTSNIRHVDIELNNEKISNIEGIDYTLSDIDGETIDIKLEISPDMLKEEWNYVEISAKWPFKCCYTETGFFLHNITNQASVYIPEEIICAARISNGQNKYGYDEYLVENYNYKSNYFGKEGIIEESENIRLNEAGIPEVKYATGWEYNPVTIAQSALGFYNDFIETNSKNSKTEFLKLADWLVNNQQENGSFPYEFSFALKPNAELPEGFISSMAQGQVLSVMIRAFYITNDVRYLDCGMESLHFMIASGDENIFAGGSKSLKDFCNLSEELKEFSEYRVYEEYVFDPSTYVLNGDLFALIGLADWMQGAPNRYGKEIAERAFYEGVKGIEILLPYYDYYGWSAYDLFNYTSNNSDPYFGSEYAHGCHICLLEALADISGSECFEKYKERFKSYVDNEFWKQTDVLYEN